MKSFAKILMLLLPLLVLPVVAHAQAVITGVQVEVLENGHERVLFTANRPVTVKKTFSLGGPDRIVVDIPSVPVTGIALPSDYRGRLLTGIRFGQFDPSTARFVLDTRAAVTVVSAQGGMPLKIELAGPAGFAGPAGGAAAPVLASPFDAVKQSAAPAADDDDDDAADDSAVQAVAAPAKAVSSPEKTPAKAAAGKKQTASKASAKAAPVSAEEKKPLVVVDAGHGGQDPGALGLHGTHEKDVTLNFARALRSALLRTGRYRVVLTRDDDVFISLQERVNIARKMKGTIFVSFHADSNPRPEARGLSIYTLSETASDDEAAALAEHENKSDIIAGMDLSTTDQGVANILIDLTQRETMGKSSQMADAVVESLHGKINRLPKTHRFAGFRVLKAPDIPSTLIELGFLSNAQDERLLLSPEYRDLVVLSVVQGIDRYLAGE